jgi:hypothetical protein
MVQRVKPSGVFYVNEHGHLIVPRDGEAFYAGKCEEYLEFDAADIPEIATEKVSPVAPRDLTPGMAWPGSHVGVRYVLCSDDSDIYYTMEEGPRIDRYLLSRERNDARAAARLAERLREHKSAGGRIYINEAREFFAKVKEEGEWSCRYLGNLHDDIWFPEPVISGM